MSTNAMNINMNCVEDREATRPLHSCADVLITLMLLSLKSILLKVRYGKSTWHIPAILSRYLSTCSYQ